MSSTVVIHQEKLREVPMVTEVPMNNQTEKIFGTINYQSILTFEIKKKIQNRPSKPENPVNKNTWKYDFFSILAHQFQADVKRPSMQDPGNRNS